MEWTKFLGKICNIYRGIGFSILVLCAIALFVSGIHGDESFIAYGIMVIVVGIPLLSLSSVLVMVFVEMSININRIRKETIQIKKALYQQGHFKDDDESDDDTASDNK